MDLNIVCTSKPCDGLFYYSYEYASELNATLIVITHPGYSQQDYKNSIAEKYWNQIKVIYDDFEEEWPTLVMGRSMITLPYLNKSKYEQDQLINLHCLFDRIITVYSENHPVEYNNALEYFKPEVIDLCDTEVYPNGVGDHFEKKINFEIYKDPIIDTQFDHLFLGTNKRYYETVEKHIKNYPSYGIITYNESYVNKKNNNIFAPVKNLLGLFETYVYTKETFDPAPRLIQECMYFGKKMVYNRDESIRDGGSIYWKRPIENLNVEPIVKAYENLL